MLTYQLIWSKLRKWFEICLRRSPFNQTVPRRDWKSCSMLNIRIFWAACRAARDTPGVINSFRAPGSSFRTVVALRAPGVLRNWGERHSFRAINLFINLHLIIFIFNLKNYILSDHPTIIELSKTFRTFF